MAAKRLAVAQAAQAFAQFRSSVRVAQQKVIDEAARFASMARPHPVSNSARIAYVTNKSAEAAAVKN